jgi:hypothetical protein
MRPRTVRLTLVAAMAAFSLLAPAATAAPPGTTEPLGPLSRPSPNCASFDPAQSAAPVKPDGWYAIGLSAPGQTLFQVIPKSRLASWSEGLTPAHNDFVGDGFVGRTDSGPQMICLTDSEPVWYQALYDTTGTGPQPPTSGPGGGVAFHQYYGWSSEG